MMLLTHSSPLLNPNKDLGDLPAQSAILKQMLVMNPPDAIGAALAYLLLQSAEHPAVVRRVLNEKVVREGFAGVSMLTVLNRLA